jgi:hypothetical protein
LKDLKKNLLSGAAWRGVARRVAVTAMLLQFLESLLKMYLSLFYFTDRIGLNLPVQCA